MLASEPTNISWLLYVHVQANISSIGTPTTPPSRWEFQLQWVKNPLTDGWARILSKGIHVTIRPLSSISISDGKAADSPTIRPSLIAHKNFCLQTPTKFKQLLSCHLSHAAKIHITNRVRFFEAHQERHALKRQSCSE